MRTDLPSGQIGHREKKTQRKKGKCPKSKSLGSASRRASTERRNTKKPFFVFLRTDLPPGQITQREERLRRTCLCFFVFFSLQNFSMRLILMTFDLKMFSFFFSQSFFSLCILPQRKVGVHKITKQVFLGLSSLCGSSP